MHAWRARTKVVGQDRHFSAALEVGEDVLVLLCCLYVSCTHVEAMTGAWSRPGYRACQPQYNIRPYAVLDWLC